MENDTLSPRRRGRRARLTALACIVLAVALLRPLPARAQRPALPAVELPQGSPIPRILPAPPPSVSPGPSLAAPPAAPAAVPPRDVAVRGVVVEGATAYPPPRLAEVTAGLNGPAIPLARIEAARLALVNLYRGDGYVLTSVVASLGANGRLRFVVTEGRIADVQLDGDIGPAGTQVLRFLHHLTETRPIDTATLERWLLLAQDVPGVSLQAVLRPSADDPGALTLVARVARQSFSGLFTIDNRAFRRTGPIESLTALDANSFTEFGERSEVSIYHTDGGTQNFGQASSEAFVGGSGLRVRVYGGYGEALPSAPLRDTRYQGFTTVFGTSATYPLIRARQETLNLTGVFDVIETAVKLGDGPATRDGLRVARLGADYAREDGLLGDARPGVTTASFRLSQGIPGLGGTHSKSSDPPPQRTGERVDFTKASFDLQRTQTLFEPWAGATVALRGRLAGQISADVLPPAEKFYLGGIDLNRGFYSGQASGDSALDWTVELQLNTGFDFVAFDRPINVGAQFYAFYDRGETWERQRVDRNARLSSEGIGARLTLTRYTEFDVEGDIRNTRLGSGAPGAPNYVKPLKADAFYWRVLTRF